MGFFRFQRRLKICKGLNVNLSKRGIGISAGPRGAKIGINSRGQRYSSFGIPGTGLSYRSVQRKGGTSFVDGLMVIAEIIGWLKGKTARPEPTQQVDVDALSKTLFTDEFVRANTDFPSSASMLSALEAIGSVDSETVFDNLVVQHSHFSTFEELIRTAKLTRASSANGNNRPSAPSQANLSEEEQSRRFTVNLIVGCSIGLVVMILIFSRF